MESGKYYVLTDGNNLYESMTKEQILAAITQAVESHTISDVDTGFVEKLKEQNSGSPLKFWVGTTAQYNAIATKQNNCFYILTDDGEKEAIETLVADLSAQVEDFSERLAGETIWNGTPVQSGEQDGTEFDLNETKFLKYRLYAITIASDANGTDSQLILAYRRTGNNNVQYADAKIFDDITASTQQSGTLVNNSYQANVRYDTNTGVFYGGKETINLSSGYTAFTPYYLISIEGVI